MEKIELLGVGISNVTVEELNAELLKIIRAEGHEHILNVNVHAMNIAAGNRWFKQFLNEAKINFCDGDGVRLAAKYSGKHIAEKITYNRYIYELAAFSSKHGLSWYILGASETTIKNAFKVLGEKYPELNVVGYHHGFLRDSNIIQGVIDDINEKKPNILILGMGMPLQEEFLHKHSKSMTFNAAFTGGAVFEYVAGEAKMTPDIFYRLKLEWFYRFCQEPGRLFTRYFFGNFYFLFRVLKSLF